MSFSRKNMLLLAAIFSIGLNLFFVGALGARYMNRPEWPSEPPSLRWVMQDLDPATRERLQPQMALYRETLRPLRRDMFRAQREVNELLMAENLDTQAVVEAFDSLREANLRYQQLSHQQLTELMAQLSSEQRTDAIRFMSERRNPDGDKTGDSSRDTSRPASNND